VVLLIDRVEDKNIALVFSHRDAHALYADPSQRFLGVTEIYFFPVRFNETEAH